MTTTAAAAPTGVAGAMVAVAAGDDNAYDTIVSICSREQVYLLRSIEIEASRQAIAYFLWRANASSALSE